METGERTERPAVPDTFAFADVEIDARAHRLSRAGREIAIEPKAFAVLLEFLTHPDQLLSRDQLLDAVWGHSFVTPATLNRIVAQLRRALADDSEAPHCIQTVHGLGYRFIAPLQAVGARKPELRFAPPAHARLPERVVSLIGRERDIPEIGRLLAQNRLVTVIGPGGIGKTQAALEAARLQAAEFPDGAWLYDCTPFPDGNTLARGVAGMFDIRGTLDADELIARLGELLQQRRALLVFDNAERIAGPLAAMITSLLAACALLHVLVTSQRRLNCAGELLYRLPPLDLPPPGEWTHGDEVATLAQVPAVQLLLVRSRASASSFTLTLSNAGAVAEICRRLEGLPLALEIAAARLRLLSPEQLLGQINHHLLNLGESRPGQPAHHQTLLTLIEWSFALLSEREQSLLCGLSVFAGGCTFGGAHAIGAAFGLDDAQMLDLLGGLIDKSLLSFDASANPPRYRLLDSVRLFALARLAESGAGDRVRDAHLAHFVAFTEHVNAGVLGPREQLWIKRVRREWANLHAAFDHALTKPELADCCVALVGNLCWYFREGMDYVEPRRWLEQALRWTLSPTIHRARALIAAGMIGHQGGLHDRASAYLRDGVALAGEQGDVWLAAAGQSILAFELATQGEIAEAEACVRAVLAVAIDKQDAWLRSMALLSRGIAHAMNDRHREAEACLNEAFEWVSSPDSAVFQKGYTLINLALQRYYLRDPRAARDWLLDLDIFLDLQHWRGAAGCVEGAAYLAIERGQPERTARFLGASERVRKLTGAPLMPQWHKGQRATADRARSELGQTYEALRRDGASARFEDIVGEAHALLQEMSATQPPRTGASSPSGS